MADREKVMAWLKKCGNGGCSSRCPYDDLGPDKCYETLMIDALELLKEQQETIASFQGTIRKLNAALAEQPEQKHGRWIDHDCGEWKCSACNDSWYLEVGDPEDNEMNYCPMCGAKMDEEVKQDG